MGHAGIDYHFLLFGPTIAGMGTVTNIESHAGNLTWRVRASNGRASRTAHVLVNGRALCGFRHFGTWTDAHQWSTRCRRCATLGGGAA